MNPALLSLYSLLILWILLFIPLISNRKKIIIRKIIKKRKLGGSREMKTLAEKFLNKECNILAFDSSHEYTGTLKEISDTAILIEQKGDLEAINLDFVIKISENKKSKKK